MKKITNTKKEFKVVSGRVLSLCLVAVLLLFMPAHRLIAAVPNLVNYQGMLKKNNISFTGTATVEFRIYYQETGGTPVWSSGAKNISVTKGNFTYNLGEDNPSDFAAIDWENNTCYLEIVIDGEVMTPRDKFTATPYALNSAKLGGKTFSEIDTLYLKKSGGTLLGDLDFDRKEARHLVVHRSATPPQATVGGQLWFDTNVNKIKVFNGTDWELIGGSGGLHATTHRAGGGDAVQLSPTQIDGISVVRSTNTAQIIQPTNATTALIIKPGLGSFGTTIFAVYNTDDKPQVMVDSEGNLLLNQRLDGRFVNPATTDEYGTVILAANGESSANKVVRANDSRLGAVGAFISSAPTINQTIQPATLGKTPLRLKGYPDDSTANVLEVWDAAATPSLAWKFDPYGNLIPVGARKIGDETNGLTIDGPVKIAEGAIQDGRIVNDDIKNRTITKEKIAAGTISDYEIANSTITTSKIADKAVTSSKIEDKTITDNQISDTAGISPLKIRISTVPWITETLNYWSVPGTNMIDGSKVQGNVAPGNHANNHRMGGADVVQLTPFQIDGVAIVQSTSAAQVIKPSANVIALTLKPNDFSTTKVLSLYDGENIEQAYFQDGVLYLKKDDGLKMVGNARIRGENISYATTSSSGVVTFATDNETAAGKAVQANDSRLASLSNAIVKVPTTHQTIEPTNNVVPLTIVGSQYGTSKLFRIFDSQDPRNEAWYVNYQGHLISTGPAGVTRNLQVTGQTVITNTASDALVVKGGIQAGSGSVGIVGADGRIPAINDTYFANLNGSALTNITASNIPDNIVSTSKIQNGAVTSSKILEGAVTSYHIMDESIRTVDLQDNILSADVAGRNKMADGYITTAKIGDNQVTDGKILSVSASKIASGDLGTGVIASSIAVNAVHTAAIRDGSITSAKIQDGTITTDDISATAGITKDQISDVGTWQASEIPDLDASKITSGEFAIARIPDIGSSKVVLSGATKLSSWQSGLDATKIDGSKIYEGSISSGAIKDGTIVDAQISDNAGISWAKISKAGSSLADLQTRSAGDLTSGTLNDARLSSNVSLLGQTIETSEITDGTIGTIDLGDGAITKEKINMTSIVAISSDTGKVRGLTSAYLDSVDGSALTNLTPGNISSGNLPSNVMVSSIAVNAVHTAAIRDGAVTGVKIADGSVGATQIADGSIVKEKINMVSIPAISSDTGRIVGLTSQTLDNRDGSYLQNISSIAANAVGTAQIADGAVTTSKISDNAVTDDKVVNALTLTGSTITYSRVDHIYGPIRIRDSADTVRLTLSDTGAVYATALSTFNATINLGSSAQLIWAGHPTTNIKRINDGEIGTDGIFNAVSYKQSGKSFDSIYLTTGSAQSITGQKIVEKSPGTTVGSASFMIYPGYSADLPGDVDPSYMLFRVGVSVQGSGGGERFRITASSALLTNSDLRIVTSGKRLYFQDISLYKNTSTDRLESSANVDAPNYYKSGVVLDNIFLTTSTPQSITAQKIVETTPGAGSSAASFMIYPGNTTDLSGDANPAWNLFRVGLSVTGSGGGEKFKVSVSSVVLTQVDLRLATASKKIYFGSDGNLGWDTVNDRLQTTNKFDAAEYYKNGKLFEDIYVTTGTAQEITGRKTITATPGSGTTVTNAAFVINAPATIPADSNLFGIAWDGSSRMRVSTTSVIIDNAHLRLPATRKVYFGDPTLVNTNLYRDDSNNKLVTDGNFKVQGNSEFNVIVSSVVTQEHIATSTNKKVILDNDSGADSYLVYEAGNNWVSFYINGTAVARLKP